ncbi:hypothetical protein [Sphingomonas olei]|uniref:Uncharacterized protein n=1 Tax=Sphingomonas olei TaxID=1886787 RepID=A0ABY2QE42_9SPHN|nr:hypothetical protein [Sphingomonas olei]THG37100.1 hypothetical protein E5988_16260 [Sphingomonas olei]
MDNEGTVRALALIAACDDPDKLKRMAANARRLGEWEIEHAAALKLYTVLPSAEPGTFEHDVWRSIHALEGALKDERGRTTLLGRTRQKIARDGERHTVADRVRGKASDGFRMLMDRGMVDHTFEAVVLRHQTLFEDEVVSAAADRLRTAGADRQ